MHWNLLVFVWFMPILLGSRSLMILIYFTCRFCQDFCGSPSKGLSFLLLLLQTCTTTASFAYLQMRNTSTCLSEEVQRLYRNLCRARNCAAYVIMIRVVSGFWYDFGLFCIEFRYCGELLVKFGIVYVGVFFIKCRIRLIWFVNKC